MKIVFWVGGIVFVAMAIPCALFFVLYLSTGEEVPRQRALMFYRFASLALLITFNIWIFGRVLGAIYDIWFAGPTLPPVLPVMPEPPASQ